MPYNLCARVFSSLAGAGASSDPSNEQTSGILQPDQCLLSRMLFSPAANDQLFFFFFF